MIHHIDDWQKTKYTVLFIYNDKDIIVSLSNLYPNMIIECREPEDLIKTKIDFSKYDFVYTGLKHYENLINVLQKNIPIVCHSALINSVTKAQYQEQYPNVLFLEKPADIHSYKFIKTINQYLESFKLRDS